MDFRTMTRILRAWHYWRALEHMKAVVRHLERADASRSLAHQTICLSDNILGDMEKLRK